MGSFIDHMGPFLDFPNLGVTGGVFVLVFLDFGARFFLWVAGVG